MSIAKALPTARIRFASWVEFARFLMQDTADRGLFVRAGTPPAIGTELNVQFVLPDQTVLELPARVIHRVTAEQSSEPGMGVQFTHMSADQAQQLQELMSNAELVRGIRETQPVVAAPPDPKTPGARPSRAQPAAAPARAPGPSPAAAPPPQPPSEPVEHLDPRLVQALTLLERSRFDAAERHVMDVIGDDPTDDTAKVLLLVVQARRLRSQFDFDRALQKYRAILKLDPKHLEARQQIEALGGEIEHSKALFNRVFGSGGSDEP